MGYRIPADERTIAFENRRKYLKPPTAEEIYEFIDELGVSAAAFERFYGIHRGTIRKIKHGDDGRILPAKHWHIIYERIKPAYGIGYITQDLRVHYEEPKKVKKVVIKKKQHISKKLLERLSDLYP